jgi:alpha-L-arabinofuranosidase
MRTVLFFIVFLPLIVMPAGSSVEAVTVRLDRPVVTRAGALGINLNYLVDSDAQRPAGSRPLTAALADLGARMLRYPGGEKSDTNLWSLPPFERPQPALARTGPNQFPGGSSQFIAPDGSWAHSPLDFDQFLEVTAATSSDPIVVVPFDSAFAPAEPGGTAPTYDQLKATAVAWVRYAAGRVKYWEIGNESYYGGYNGTPTRAQYIAGVIDFSRAMKAVDPTIQIGANGRDSAWWEALIQQAGPDIDFLSVHDYPIWNMSGYSSYKSYSHPLNGLAKLANNAVDTYASSADKARLWIAVTELNVIDYGTPGWADTNDLGHAVALAQTIGDHLTLWRVRRVLAWNTRWIDYATNPHHVTDMLTDHNQLQPTGAALRLWSQATLPTTLETSSTSRIKIYASRDGTSTRLLIINRDTSARTVRVTFSGGTPGRAVSGQMLAGSGPSDLAPTLRTLPAWTWSSGRLQLTLPGVSIAVVHLE